jgi:ferric-dicitrate binding protein FerR (iron transport regulator)
MTETTGSNILPLSEQAAEWVVCMSDKHITPAQRAEFEAWLTKDPRHRGSLRGNCFAFRHIQFRHLSPSVSDSN